MSVPSIRYMGSKKQLAPSIAQIIREEYPDHTLVDLFAGTCAVGTEMASTHVVESNDIHAYAGVISRSLLVNTAPCPSMRDSKKELIKHYQNNYEALYEIFEKEIDAEEEAIALSLTTSKGWKQYKIISNESLAKPYPLRKKALAPLSVYKEDNKLFPYSLFSRYFSGGYFSMKQAAQIDSIRYAIDCAAPKNKDYYLHALIRALSACAASPGHFAQFLIPRDRINTKYIARMRARSVRDIFFSALDDFSRPTAFQRRKNRQHQYDATSFLVERKRHLLAGDYVIYADPPYSRAQYSRYYHLLETLVKYDYPACNDKGRYRADRISTDFSRKSKVVCAMDEFISSVAACGAPLFLSYPKNGLVYQAGGNLRLIMKKYFPKVEVAYSTPLMHSTLGSSGGAAAINVVEEVYYGYW